MKLSVIQSYLEVLRKADPAMSIATAIAFLEVATAHPELVTSQQIKDRLGFDHSGPTRVMDLLEGGRKGRAKAGLGLVERMTDAEDRRRRLYRFSKRGKQVVMAFDG